MNPIYKKYKERFIQISGRNRSLFLKDIIKKYSYDIGAIMENRSDTDELIEFLWHGRRTFSLINDKVFAKLLKQAAKTEVEAELSRLELAAATAETAEDAENMETLPEKVSSKAKPKDKLTKIVADQMGALKYLKREVEELEKETGLYELYIGYPFVIGKLTPEIELRAPLMLFPAHLHIEKDEATLTLTPNQPVMLNKAFVLAYSMEHNVPTDKLIQEFDPLAEDTFSTPTDVVEYLIKNGFKMRYSKRKGMIPFSTATPVLDGLEVKNYAVLGRFPLANPIYNDYLALEKDDLTTPSIDALLSPSPQKRERQRTGFFRRRTPVPNKDLPVDYYEINDLDFAQENALSEINREDNVVVYGPPGTGKSQTIVNIISDALCKKKRVLVVSQKRAALDVVFSRLGKLNNKAMLIPDPEKDKIKFFERLRNMHNLTASIDYNESQMRYQNVSFNIQKEIDTLQSISNTLFTPTSFGLTLQEMYAASYNIGKDGKDYKFYEALKETEIIDRNYPELNEDLRLIADKNLAKLYFSRSELVRENEMITHIRNDIDMHQLKEARAFLQKILTRDLVPFDLSRYPHSRYLTTFYLENNVENRRSIARVADIVTRIEHPTLARWVSASVFPLLWPIFPFVKTQYNIYREDIKIDLNIAKRALEDFEEEYRSLDKILDAEGYAMAIGGILNGNSAFLQKLKDALDNYVKVRDMNTAIVSLTPEVQAILEFCFAQSDGTLPSFKEMIDKVMPVRIYHEIVINDSLIEPVLSKTVTFEELRKRIISLKVDQREISKKLAVDTFSAEYVSYFKEAQDSKDFLYEMQKQRALKPIRKMFEYFEEHLLRLFPCWLLSPEVVSTILPLKRDLFDLVVFDEASQIFIESALPAIYRGTKIVIAGDNKQLRPSAGFVKRYFGDDSIYANFDLSTQAALEVESLLDLATARYYPVDLSYHYRSNYAELIDFSNAAFYDNKLQIAPNITRSSNFTPIERIKVRGMWQQRRNHEEAVAVVKLLRTIFREREMNETVGIVTFNTEQKEYIEDMLDAEADKVSTFRKQLFAERNRIVDGENVSLFVKNLENVQGEERDIIIFSVGYAKNDYDRVVAQFGSLSTEGGENRLNVAITRAKKKIYVVTSIEPEELDRAETTKNNGPKLLKRYLQYVRAVSDKKEGEAKAVLATLKPLSKTINPIGAYEAQIKSALEQLGYEVDINLGNTDYKLSLGIYDSELQCYVLGVECDYQAFHSSKSVLERDVYRIKFLESRGWKIVRVWSRDWWLSPNKVLDDLVTMIERQKSLLRELRTKNN